jgi:DNA-binding NtrC family response regulator
VQEALWRTRSMTAEPTPSAPNRQEAAPAAVDRPDPPAWSPPRTLDKPELEQLMERFQGHVAAAARHVGMTRPKLYRLLGAHGLEPNEFRRPRVA